MMNALLFKLLATAQSSKLPQVVKSSEPADGVPHQWAQVPQGDQSAFASTPGQAGLVGNQE